MLDGVGVETQLKSPKMVAAVLSSCYRYQPSRDVVNRRREQFERGFSDSCLLVKTCRLHRGRSADSFKARQLNEAQRLVKYRSSSSLLSLDSGLSSHDGSTNTSAEDVRAPLSRSSSNDRFRLRIFNDASFRRLRSSRTSSFSSAGSSPEPKTPELFGKNYSSKNISPSPNISFPDLLPSPPLPIPPKSRPPLPPRRRTESANSSSQQSSGILWDGDSGESSDISLPEFPNEDQERGTFLLPNFKSSIPQSFAYKDSLNRFLSDLSHSHRGEVVVQNVSGGASGNLSLKAIVGVPVTSSNLSHPADPSDSTEIQVQISILDVVLFLWRIHSSFSLLYFNIFKQIDELVVFIQLPGKKK